MHTVPIPLVCLFQKASFRRASECCVLLFWWCRAREVDRELDLAPPLTFELSLLLLVLRSASMAKAKNSSWGTNVFDFTFTIEISSYELKWYYVWVWRKKKPSKKEKKRKLPSYRHPTSLFVCCMKEKLKFLEIIIHTWNETCIQVSIVFMSAEWWWNVKTRHQQAKNKKAKQLNSKEREKQHQNVFVAVIVRSGRIFIIIRRHIIFQTTKC